MVYCQLIRRIIKYVYLYFVYFVYIMFCRDSKYFYVIFFVGIFGCDKVRQVQIWRFIQSFFFSLNVFN